jgi:unsaturated rhamnogalacturonyl hydrolase
MPVLDYADQYARTYQPYKAGVWCYEDGLLYLALVRLHQATGEARWIEHLLRLTSAQIARDGTLAGYAQDEFNIDNILAGRCLFHLSEQTGDPRYQIAANALAGQLARHPRTKTGNYWHKAIYPQQVWLDGLYMALPFQIEYGLRTGQSLLVNDALMQFEWALALTRRPDGLYAHGYDDARAMYWADPETGQSKDLWGRSLGWLAMALVDACALIEATPDAVISRAVSDLLARLQPLATPAGLWLQVPDQRGMAGNYAETSASAMLAYAYLVGDGLGLAPGGTEFGGRTLLTLSETMLKAGPKGQFELGQICLVAGLGGNGSRRDGTAAYYLSEVVGADDPKGVGPFLMAEAVRLGNLKQCLANPA